MSEARWLNPEQAAAYVGRRVDELPRLVKAGKLPKPSLHFGPRSPRYDRLALDALFERKAPLRQNIDEAVNAAATQIRARAVENRPPEAR